MDWTDTLMLEMPRLYVEPTPETGAEAMDVRVAQGITLIHANITTYEQTAVALKSLRGFRATSRRVILCDTSHIIAGRQLGGEMVVDGGASLLVSCGRSGREVAIGARDAGLDLSNVVVCRDAFSACELLSCRLVPGDTLLLLGADQVACERLIQLLDNRQTFPLKAAA